MATVTITVPDEAALRIANAICQTYGYDESSGQSPIDFTQSVVFRWLTQTTLDYEAKVASDVARDLILSNQDDPLVNAVMEFGS